MGVETLFFWGELGISTAVSSNRFSCHLWCNGCDQHGPWRDDHVGGLHHLYNSADTAKLYRIFPTHFNSSSIFLSQVL